MAMTDEERRAKFAEEAAKAPSMTQAEFRQRSRRSVLTGGATMAAGLLGWRWLHRQEEDNNIPSSLRDVFGVNEALWNGLYRPEALAPTFDRSESSMVRVNGRHGIREEIDLDQWQMNIFNGTEQIGTHVMDDITALPKVEMTVEHKCVEGWSHIVTWGGVRFSDFAALYADEINAANHVALTTPDDEYFVGLEVPSMMHPQTLLAYELQEEPLDQEHGAPLRLVTPLKYGIKMIKRIGNISFVQEQPDDFWLQRGYDYHSGL